METLLLPTVTVPLVSDVDMVDAMPIASEAAVSTSQVAAVMLSEKAIRIAPLVLLGLPATKSIMCAGVKSGLWIVIFLLFEDCVTVPALKCFVSAPGVYAPTTCSPAALCAVNPESRLPALTVSAARSAAWMMSAR